MDFIDYLDSRPIYEQIASRYKQLILTGVLSPNEKLPSVRKLAMELSTNPNTVQKAYAMLEREGYLYSVKGRGNFVRENDSLIDQKKDELKGKMKELIKEIQDLGLDPQELFTAALEEAEEDDRD
ncbi:Transcriptional regulator, GntR family [Lactobacillus equicursoris DSM 19284 = JCM 14600 = CIP 110162]|uniref:Transcriptional regulator, gntr family n=2 Tax=Lactobacillus equicursoris TaxID=420645 RepID=K0NXF8_9LACO|nr:GntR family transcriptional regulator [Lactobacillus equicursoris]KRL00343.1 transcriptional regulator, gntr family [Lactobacillus equicursoris DSM 19284 = JCM 14600 = CIP 110162]MST80026.1 GntR family transcriptional regulator [Lactobacillus equicursoris]CCK85791.1 Transcriptional regulator, GntR family [Lactobacillus equicursoris DSM 19284 = JCM 14600 = CIP 110162]